MIECVGGWMNHTESQTSLAYLRSSSHGHSDQKFLKSSYMIALCKGNQLKRKVPFTNQLFFFFKIQFERKLKYRWPWRDNESSLLSVPDLVSRKN
jgi:hypothetical protein